MSEQDELTEIIKNQGSIGPSMAKIIAERTGRSERLVIARAMAISRYSPNSSETHEQAASRFREGGRKPILRYAAIALVVLLIGLGVLSLIGDGDGSSETQLARCEAELKPKLDSCLGSSASANYEICRSAYLNSLKECTGN